MNINDIIRKLAEYYHLEPCQNGKYNLDDYDWTSGCSMGYGDKWLSLANVVEALANDFEWDEYWHDHSKTDWDFEEEEI